MEWPMQGVQTTPPLLQQCDSVTKCNSARIGSGIAHAAMARRARQQAPQPDVGISSSRQDPQLFQDRCALRVDGCQAPKNSLEDFITHQ
jgi:hypothetical protein